MADETNVGSDAHEFTVDSSGIEGAAADTQVDAQARDQTGQAQVRVRIDDSAMHTLV